MKLSAEGVRAVDIVAGNRLLVRVALGQSQAQHDALHCTEQFAPEKCMLALQSGRQCISDDRSQRRERRLNGIPRPLGRGEPDKLELPRGLNRCLHEREER